MPNVERGLEVCAEVGLRGCKRCPFKGSQYCTSLLAQGALTMIKGLKKDYAELKDKRPTVNDELDTLIKATVNALNTGDATCKLEVSKSDAGKLASFLSASLEASNRVSLNRTIPWGFAFSEDGLTERLSLAIRRSLDMLGVANPEDTGRDGCHCLMCNIKRELHEAYLAYADAHGEEAARVELDRRTSRENISREIRDAMPTVYTEAIPYQRRPVDEEDIEVPFGAPISADDFALGMNSEREEPQNNTEPNVETQDDPSGAVPSPETPRINSGFRTTINEIQRILRRSIPRYEIEPNPIEEPTQRSDR